MVIVSTGMGRMMFFRGENDDTDDDDIRRNCRYPYNIESVAIVEKVPNIIRYVDSSSVSVLLSSLLI